MKTYSKEVIKALDESIEKWFGITFLQKFDGAYHDCPLCQIFMVGKDSCNGCPIKDYTGKGGCGGTPYVSWANQNSRRVNGVKTAELAKDFYEWLKELRSNVEEGKDEKYYLRIRDTETAIGDGDIRIYIVDSKGDLITSPYVAKINIDKTLSLMNGVNEDAVVTEGLRGQIKLT